MCVCVCVCVFCEGLNLTDILYRMLRDKDPLVRRDRVQGGGTEVGLVDKVGLSCYFFFSMN